MGFQKAWPAWKTPCLKWYLVSLWLVWSTNTNRSIMMAARLLFSAVAFIK